MKAIAATSLNNVIGKDGTIPWHSKADFQWFKKVTMDQNLVVGRKTFEKLPYLPGRHLWVLSSGLPNSPVIGRYEPHEIRFVNDIDILPRNSIIAGGAKVYESLLPYCDELLLTVINKEVEGDTFFPPYKHLFNFVEVLESNDELTIFRLFK